MITEASAQVSATKPAKSPIPSSLKVDNLRHISDHGLAVQFTDRKLAAMVEHLNSRDGVTRLTAGQSSLTLTRLGNVTLTEAFWSVGTRHENRIHYLDGDLKYSFAESVDSDAFAALRSVIFGAPMPRIFTPTNGAQQDALRTHLARYAWTLAGVSGLRAHALEHDEQLLREGVSNAATRVRTVRNELEGAGSETPEFYGAQRAGIKDRHGREAGYYSLQADTIRKWLAMSELPVEARRSAGVIHPTYYAAGPYLPATASTSSHPVRIANYSATVSSEGQISLSSGIGCEFTLPRLLQWLKGEANAPQTRYGAITKVACSTPDGRPTYLLKCGCHWVDAARCSSELAELLKPDFTVDVVPGRPRVELPSDAPDAQKEPFFAECRARLTLQLEAAEQNRRKEIENMVRALAQSKEREATQPQRVAELEVALVDATAGLQKAEAALSAPRAQLGATLEQIKLACLAAPLAFSVYKL
jgi:hypothetical protein